MSSVTEIFGSLVFSDAVMRERLPRESYQSLRRTVQEGVALDPAVANVVAACMKDWAIEHGATHYTHWFQPMTGITAEKHDSFLSPQPDGSVIMEFSGKELIKGEPDASSFPSGGLRATFEARGYTAWDPTSYAFIKDNSLCIPTAFCSYGGEVLDKKTPILRSMEVLNKQAVRVLRLLGDTTTKRVISTVGSEQEYFLLDRALYKKRRDLVYTGRTLFGAKPPKGQELEDHYFGAIRPRVMAFMRELNEELWKLGVYAKTEHNEVAPAQHELAPVYTTTNIAVDQNQITMEVMKRVAERHGLACLLHEKPFAGVNGSGKHNNWSVATDTGVNLFEPGKSPAENRQFLLFLCAVVRAVDENQDMLRITVSSAGNDHRLGANEAPPAIVSMFLGSELTDILTAIRDGKPAANAAQSLMNTRADVLPDFQKDTTDRNRTSPLAFTGNKFEFRMLGSSFSIAGPNIVLNTMLADVLSDFADRLEKAADRDAEMDAIMRDTLKAHDRIIFNGNNYAAEWVEEAERRGLLNLRTTADCLPLYVSEKNIGLFTRHGIFTAAEMHSRYEIHIENYCKVIAVEALTMLDMVKKDILPASLAYARSLAEGIAARKAVGAAALEDEERAYLDRVSLLCGSLIKKANTLDKAILGDHGDHGAARAAYMRDVVLPAMGELRAVGDELETVVSSSLWPYPTYGELLFSV